MAKTPKGGRVARLPKKRKGRIALIHQLPVEILSEIFQIYVHDSFDSAGHHSKGAFPLGAICQTWRLVAWSTTLLWTTIAIRVGPQTSETVMELASGRLNRSGQHLLDADLSINPSVDLMEVKPKAYNFIVSIANQYASCFLGLHLQVPPSMFPLLTNLKNATSLDTLVINTRYSEYTLDLRLGPAPSIAFLRGVLLGSLIFNPANLKDFVNLEFVYVDQLFQLLSSAPNPRICGQLDLRSRRTEPREEIKSVIHHHLELLNLLFTCEETYMIDFFQKATLTKLSCLHCDFSDRDMPTVPFADFLRRSCCPLVELTLDQLAVSGEDLVQVLRLVPSLTTFYLAPCLIAPLLPLDAFYIKLSIPPEGSVRPSEESPVLLLLEELSIQPGPVFPWHLLPSFFRGVEDTPARPLKDVQIKCHPMEPGINNDVYDILEPTGIIDDRKTLDELVKLQGVNLTCHMERKHGLVDMIGFSSRVLDAYDRKGSRTLTEQEEYEIHRLSLV